MDFHHKSLTLSFSYFIFIVLIYSNSFVIEAGKARENKERSDLAKQAFSKANLEFASKAYDVLKDFLPREQNIVFSPTILTTNIGLLRAGTNGSTNEELQASLKMSEVPSDLIKEGIADYLGDLPDDADEIILETAQRLYIPSTYKVLHSFQENVLDDYSELLTTDDPIKSINFAEAVTSSAKINNWFRKSTHGKIQDIVHPELFSGATKLVCISGLYFNAQWEKKFRAEKTKSELFYVSKSKYTNTQMMNQLGRFSYINLPNLNGSAISIPYAGKRLSLIVIVPYELNGLQGLEQKLPTVPLDSIINGMKKRNVDVYLPKFRLESNIVMNTHRAHLRKLGLDSTVSARDNPDFSKLSPKKGLHLDQVIQKVIYEIDEKGITSPPKLKKVKNENEPVIFRADHPFILFLYDRESKTILLMGKKMR